MRAVIVDPEVDHKTEVGEVVMREEIEVASEGILNDRFESIISRKHVVMVESLLPSGSSSSASHRSSSKFRRLCLRFPSIPIRGFICLVVLRRISRKTMFCTPGKSSNASRKKVASDPFSIDRVVGMK